MENNEFENILNSLNGASKAMPSDDFAEKVLARWQNKPSKSAGNPLFYWAAACLAAFTVLNALSFAWINYSSTAEAEQRTMNTMENQFSYEYQLITDSEFYTTNEQ